MTHAENPPASQPSPLAPDVRALDERSRRAWTESMAVRPLADGRYAVDSESGATYVVDLGRGHCSCPDSEIRGELCKHARRVAIEINQGRLPAPRRTATCAACGRETAVATDDEPVLCSDCRVEPGDLVYDRERGPDVPMLVVAVTDRRADEVPIPEADTTVARYGDNRRYPASDPVVEVVYPRSVRPERPPRRYSFPISRLARPGGDGEQTTLSESAAGG